MKWREGFTKMPLISCFAVSSAVSASLFNGKDILVEGRESVTTQALRSSSSIRTVPHRATSRTKLAVRTVPGQFNPTHCYPSNYLQRTITFQNVKHFIELDSPCH
jgi:hypothetical protein